jgi:predicted HTH transcriptional regulator
MDKMTKREFYTAIMNGEIDEQVKLFASEELEKMDAANEKRRNTLSKKAQENLPLLQQITDEILTEEPKTATDVAAVLEVSVQKASGLLRRLVEEGKATKVDVKIKGKGTQKGYSKIQN